MTRYSSILLLGLIAALPARADLASILAPVSEDDVVAYDVPSDREAASSRAEAETPDRYLIQPRELLDELARQLAQHFEADGVVELLQIRALSSIAVDSPAWELEVTRYPQGGLAPRMAVGCRLLVGGQTVSDFSLAVRARLIREVYVARRQLDRSTPLDTSDFEARRVDVLARQASLVPSREVLANYQLTQSVGEGQPLLWRAIEPKPLVRKGQVVEATAREGYLQISMKAQALENGLEGEFIALRNLATRQEIQARIIDANTVEVYF